MERKKPQLELEIASDPELLRLLTAKPELYRKIVAAASISEQVDQVRSAYVTATDHGFNVLSGVIQALEIPLSETGEPQMNEAGTAYLYPYADPETGELLYWRFFRWMMQEYLKAFKQPQPKIEKQSTPLEALPLGSHKVN